MADYGYDVADYRDVDPLFGDLADLDHLLAELHGRGMRLLLDLVPNHTSSEHPWFVESRSSPHNPKRDWYWWRDPGPDGGPPNNWIAGFTQGPAWTLDEASGQYYLHSFLPEQPDLNWGNPEVEAAMHDVVRFWLDRGIDGFRIDVVDLIGKDPALPDDPPERAGWQHVVLHDDESTHDLLRRCGASWTGYAGERVTVGEISLFHSPGRDLLRRGRRASPGVQLPSALTEWDAERGSAASTRTIRARPGRRMADLGARQPRRQLDCAPATGPKPAPEPRQCCCSRCAAPRSCTPATSSASRTRS